MDSSTLRYSLDLVSGNGYTVSGEQRAALHTSLQLLKKNYRFTRVLFWGKVLGLKQDYYIAQGKGEDEMKDTKFLYSFNCMEWHLLPPADARIVGDVSKAARGRFVGDPSHEYVQSRLQGEEEDAPAIKVTEEKRLAVTVHLIDEEASVVPRGAFTRTPHGRVQANRSFEGTRVMVNLLHKLLHCTSVDKWWFFNFMPNLNTNVSMANRTTPFLRPFMVDNTILCGYSFRAVEPAVGERQQCVCDPQPAVAGHDVLPHPNDATAWLRLYGGRLQELGPALHAL
ncbi:unnamed protein product, partial [Merluccius merluccius]